jgi:hypothetical protein
MGKLTHFLACAKIVDTQISKFISHFEEFLFAPAFHSFPLAPVLRGEGRGEGSSSDF